MLSNLIFSGNFLNITSGISIAWFITNADKFRRYETPLQVPPLIYDEIKWIECSFYIGGFIGTIFLTLMADGFGRKNTLMVLIIPQLVIASLQQPEEHYRSFICSS